MLTSEIIKKYAYDLGFDLVGFTGYEKLSLEIERLTNWLENGYNATMQYMQKNIDKREDPKLILDDCKTIISLGMNYYQKVEYQPEKPKISKYALGKDYHLVIWNKLEILLSKLKELRPELKYYYNVDTGPVMDKVWAERSGLGWMGKNSNIINPKKGSFFFIATIFINEKIDYNPLKIDDHCGTCSKCIDACPTNAIVQPYVIDSNKCISFLTIENKSDEINEKFKNKMENWAFGCDICQDVCPWNNKFSDDTKIEDFKEHLISPNIDYDYFENMTNKEFKNNFKESPILRAKLKGMKRNTNFLKY